jgi:hypothetical protein
VNVAVAVLLGQGMPIEGLGVAGSGAVDGTAVGSHEAEGTIVEHFDVNATFMHQGECREIRLPW